MYACHVWYTNLPQYLSDNVEVIHKSASKCILPGLVYAVLYAVVLIWICLK